MQNKFIEYKTKLLKLLNNLRQKGFFHLLSAKFLLRFLGFGSQILVVKFLTATEMGQIKTMQSFISVAAILASFGFNTAVLKICSEKRELEEKEYLFKKNLSYTIYSFSAVLVIMFILSLFKVYSPDPAVNRWMPIFMLTLPASALGGVITNYMQALKRIKLMANIQIYFKLAGVVSLIALTYFFGFTGFIISSLFISYLGLPIMLRLVLTNLGKTKKVENAFSTSFYYAKWSVGANVISTIGANMDIFMLNFLIADRESFGYYGVATIFISAMRYATDAVREIAAPYFSEKSGDREEFMRVLRKYEKLMFLFSLSVTIISVAAVPAFIQFVYGVNFTSTGVYFSILALQFLIGNSFSILGIAVWGVGKIKYNFISTTLNVPITIVLSYIFITHYGILGAAVAQALAAFISLFIWVPMTKKAINQHFNELEEKAKLNTGV